MKKKTIIIGVVVLVLAVLITALCTNLFGCRDWTTNFINRIHWKIDHQNVAVQSIVRSIIGESTNFKLKHIEKIIFPEEAYVDDYNVESFLKGNVQEQKRFGCTYEFKVIIPKEKVELFAGALTQAGYNQVNKEDLKNIPQTFGSLSEEQIQYVFEVEFAMQSNSPDEYVRGIDSVRVYIAGMAEETVVIISA